MLASETNVELPESQTAIASTSSAVWNEIAVPLRPFLEQVSGQLALQVRAFDPEIAACAEYALANQGKQLRPALAGMSARAVGQCNDAVVSVAVIIDMDHMATLVHDDVIDHASLRRSKPTLASRWGNPVAVLLGDCLFAHALKLAAEFPTTNVCRAVSAATRTVCSGEILQTNRQGNLDISQDDYFKMLRMKTAELFALACELGGATAGGSREQQRALCQYGLALGTAYQLYDDCLDLFGTEEQAGKSLGADFAGGKATLPVILLIEQAGPEVREKLTAMVRHWKPGHYDLLRGWLAEFNTLEQSLVHLERLLDEARQTIAALPRNDWRDRLESLTRFLAQLSGELGVA